VVLCVDEKSQVQALNRSQPVLPMMPAHFWEKVAAVLEPDGRVIFVDDGPAGATAEEVLHDLPVPVAMRQVDDGRRYRIVKVFHDAGQLTGDLAALGWSAQIRAAVENYIVGVAQPAARSGE
jgi:hypothetical protein